MLLLELREAALNNLLYKSKENELQEKLKIKIKYLFN
jgi:hypothetical protein